MTSLQINGIIVQTALPSARFEIDTTVAPAVVTVGLSPLTPDALAAVPPVYAEKYLYSIGLRIEAIRGYRERVHCGLKDAKDALERWTNTEEYRAMYDANPTMRQRLRAPLGY